MKKNLIYLLALGFLPHLFAQEQPPAPHVITFFVQPYPHQQVQEKTVEQLEQKIGTPGKVPSSIARHQLAIEQRSGVYATYNGYVTRSNRDGQIIFPRKTVEPTFHFLVTQKIKPVFMAKNTVHHFVVEKDSPANYYECKRTTDPETKLTFWDVQEKPLPSNRRIPLNTITIFAQPKHVDIPRGITLTDKSSQLILPPIFVKKGINKSLNALHMLKVRTFFGPITTKRTQKATAIQSMIQT